MTWYTFQESADRYREACQRAARDDDAFAAFRQDPGVRSIVEGLPDVAGQGYLAKLEPTALFQESWHEIARNDLFGSPLTIATSQGPLAATSLRYAWNVCDMRQHGVELTAADVVEVGGGYGGLCRMIHAFEAPRSYTIVDLPEALELAGRYLAEYGIRPRLVSCLEYGEEPIGTFVSNYALTELSKDVQHEYADRLMKRATHGYVTFNSQSRYADDQYSLLDLRDMVPGRAELHDENVRRSECRVLTWRPAEG